MTEGENEAEQWQLRWEHPGTQIKLWFPNSL